MANSGHGGRERQGLHQRDNAGADEFNISSGSDDEEQPQNPPADAVQRPFRPNTYVRWSTDKVLVVLQAIEAAPTRINQTIRFETANNSDELRAQGAQGR